MQYVYENASGERREITQGMNEDHPEAIRRVGRVCLDGCHPSTLIDDWEPCSPDEPGAFARVYANVQVNGDPVSGRYPYVSSSLPPTLDRRLAPNRDAKGFVVVENRKQDREIQAATGWTKG